MKKAKIPSNSDLIRRAQELRERSLRLREEVQRSREMFWEKEDERKRRRATALQFDRQELRGAVPVKVVGRQILIGES